MIRIEIDKNSGFCFGVVNAIRKAEKELEQESELFCLGDIVHNTNEVNRLQDKGLVTIGYGNLPTLQGKKVLFRAHGEPPSVYELARKQGINIIDATCPVVLQVQRNIRKNYEAHKQEGWQIVIFGQRGHAEVNGLVGQTEGNAIVLESVEEAEQLDFSRPIVLFSQTTKSLHDFNRLIEYIQQHLKEGVEFEYHDTICRQVAMRIPNIGKFAKEHSRVFFVAGKKSSNGKVLFAECKKNNEKSFFISDLSEITFEMLPESQDVEENIGICGATSTPKSQMEEAAAHIAKLIAALPH